MVVAKSLRQQLEEDALVAEYVELVEQRNRLVMNLEDDRIR